MKPTQAGMRLGIAPVTPLERAGVSRIIEHGCQQYFELVPCLALLQHLVCEIVLSLYKFHCLRRIRILQPPVHA